MTLTYNEVGLEIDGVFFPVEMVSFSTQSAISPNRKITSAPVRWGAAGARMDRISLKGLFTPECGGLFNNKTGQSTGMMVNIAGMNCSGVHIDSLRYSLSPFSPIRFDAELTVFGGVSGYPSGSYNPEPTGDLAYRYDSVDDLCHGLFTDFEGFDQDENVSNPASLNVSYTFEREPRYLIGDTYPETVSLIRAEKEVLIEGDGWDKIISFEGDFITGAINLNSSYRQWGVGYSASGLVSGHAFLTELSYLSLFEEIVTSGKIIEQTLDSEEILRGSIKIKEVLL